MAFAGVVLGWLGSGWLAVALQLRGDAYPGRKAVRRRASERCDREAVATTGAPAPDDYWIWFPSADSWQGGDRHVLCVLVEDAAVGLDASAGA